MSTKPSGRARRTWATTTAVLLVAGSAVALPAAGAAPAAAAQGVTVRPDPWFAGEPFEGWGTSLVWFANATGGYPDEVRERLYDLLFTEEGLDLNIARYNIGGGNASDVTDYLRAGGAVPGWWRADPDGSTGLYGPGVATTYAQKEAVREAFDPEDDAYYDWDADAGQRWWVQQLAEHDQVTHWEAFANSAPWFMTESGYVSGGFNASSEQLTPSAVDDFAAYLTRVVEHLEDAYGIDVATIDPLNEPNTGYWGTTLTGGAPTGGRQEGMHVGPARQAALVTALAARLAAPGTTTDAVVSAMDETNPSTFVTDWNGYDEQARAAVGQMNVHTYGTSDRLKVRDLAKTADKPLWMSEIEGSWVSGWDPTDMANGLGIASRINDDLRELEPSAWVLWQPVEDLYNMEPTGENLNWGAVFVDLDCQYYDVGGTQVFASARRVADAGGDAGAVPECGVAVNSKFNVLRNYTHAIRPGDRIVPTDSAATTAAVGADGSGLALVYSNATSAETTVTVDLSGFGQIDPGASATPYTTTQSPADDPTADALVPGAAVPVDRGARTVTLTVPARSVTSVLVDGVSGVSATARAVDDGSSYQVVGVQSGKALTANAASPATTITSSATTAGTAASQVWTFHEVPAQRTATRQYVVTAADGRVLRTDGSGTALTVQDLASASADPAARWVLSTTNGTTVSLVNVARSAALEVGGQSVAEGATVGWYGSNGGANQSWTLRELTPTGHRPIAVSTLVGVAPQLPATATPSYRWGDGSPVAVAWSAVPGDAWDRTGSVTVSGTATDVFGTAFAVTATVDVGGYTTTDPVSVTTYAGSALAAVQAAAPTTVPARVGASTASYPAPVTWDWSGVDQSALATPGVVRVPGTATSNDPATGGLPAVLSVVVTAPAAANIAPDPTTTASATFTESASYGVDRTRNGVVDDKGWSNWRSGTKNASDTLTYTFPEPRDLVASRIFFYRDGTTSWAQTMRVEYRDASGAWLPVPGYETPQAVASPPSGAPVVEVDLAGVRASGLRYVLDAYPNTHMIVSEVEIDALGPSASSVADLAALRVDGVDVAGFDAADLAYTTPVAGSALPRVTAVPVDAQADVRVTQPTAAEPRGTAVVTAPDGSTRTYTVDVERHVALGAVTLAGTAKVGRALTANATPDPSDASLAYAWSVDGVPVPGADGPTWTLPPSAGESAVTVTVTASAPGFVAAVGTAPSVTVAPLSSDTTLADLTVDGVTVPGFAPTGTAYDVEVLGAAYPAIGAVANDASAAVTVTQPADAGGTGTVVVRAESGDTRTYTVAVARRVALVAPAVTGRAFVGLPLTVVAATDPGDAARTYRWTVGGAVVPDATGATYTPRPADAGKALTVTVGATADGFRPAASWTSPPTTVGEARPVVSVGAAQVTAGDTVEVTATGLTPGGQVAVDLRSDPVRLAASPALANGAYRTTVRIPAGTVPGEHTLVVTDVTSGAQGSATVVVVAPGTADGTGAGSGSPAGAARPADLATTGGDALVPALLAGCLLLAGAVGAAAHRRRRA